MEQVNKYLTEQYHEVRESRRVLIEYCKMISPPLLFAENSSFGRGGSIISLLVHVVNTYQFWIAKTALGKAISFPAYQSVHSVKEVADMFDEVDRLMMEFITAAHFTENDQLHYEIQGAAGKVSKLKLFTHVITHEFHHKGQILSLSRHLGYTPVDTDIVR